MASVIVTYRETLVILYINSPRLPRVCVLVRDSSSSRDKKRDCKIHIVIWGEQEPKRSLVSSGGEAQVNMGLGR